MRVTKKLTFIRTLFLLSLVIATSTGAMSAKDFCGTFSLARQIDWGLATLPPGDYTFKLNIDVVPYVVSIEGKPIGTVRVFAAGLTSSPQNGQSSLVVVRRGGKAIVRNLYLATEGKTFNYHVPKGDLPVAASNPLLIQRIPVVMSGM